MSRGGRPRPRRLRNRSRFGGELLLRITPEGVDFHPRGMDVEHRMHTARQPFITASDADMQGLRDWIDTYLRWRREQRPRKVPCPVPWPECSMDGCPLCGGTGEVNE